MFYTFIRFHSSVFGYDRDNGSFQRSYEASIREKISRDSHAGAHLDFSYQSVASCPSPSRTSTYQSNNYVPRGYHHIGDHHSFMSNARSEYSFYNFHDEQQKSLELNKSSGAYSSSGSGPSGYEPLSWILKEESTSLYNYSVVCSIVSLLLNF